MKDQTYLDRESNLTPGISKISAKNVNVYYDDVQALKDVSVEIEKNAVTSFIGPSGCGKSTFLRCLNRMNDTIDICKVTGQILLEGEDIYDPKIDPVQLRAKVGMVFQKPNPFPKSISENIVYGAFEIVSKKTDKSPFDFFHEALNNVKPNLEVRSRRVGGATYQVPVEVKSNRSQALALRWILDASRKRKNKTMAEKLSFELLDAYQKKGSAIKKKEDTHKMAESNKAFAHFRW